MLLHLCSEEVGSKFCCVTLQLIANRASIGSQTYGLSQAAKTFAATTQRIQMIVTKRYFHRAKHRITRNGLWNNALNKDFFYV